MTKLLGRTSLKSYYYAVSVIYIMGSSCDHLLKQGHLIVSSIKSWLFIQNEVLFYSKEDYSADGLKYILNLILNIYFNLTFFSSHNLIRKFRSLTRFF